MGAQKRLAEPARRIYVRGGHDNLKVADEKHFDWILALTSCIYGAFDTRKKKPPRWVALRC